MADAESEAPCVELRGGSQVTIPDGILSQLNLEEGDQLEITVKDGCICMTPVAVYPKELIDEWTEESDEIYEDIASGKRRPFTNVNDLIEELEARCKTVASDVCT